MLPVSRAVLSLPALPVPPAGVTGLGGGGGRGWGWAGAGRPGRDRGRPRGGSGRSHIAARALLLTLCAGPGRAGLPVGTGAAGGDRSCSGLVLHRATSAPGTGRGPDVHPGVRSVSEGPGQPGSPPCPPRVRLPRGPAQGTQGSPPGAPLCPVTLAAQWGPGAPPLHHTGHSVLPCQPCPQLMGWVPPPEGPQEGAGSSR